MPPPPRPGANGPKLPFQLLKQLGGDSKSKNGRGGPEVTSRKDRRKAERNDKKRAPSRPAAPPAKTPRPILKQKQKQPKPEESDGDDVPPNHDEFDDDDDLLEEGDDDDEDDEGVEPDFSEEDSSEGDEEPSPAKASLSKGVKDKLAQDDAEIAALEKKLGLKGRKKLPQAFQEDGLADLLDDLDGESDGGKSDKKKRKAEADEWLASKRRKAAGLEAAVRKADPESEDSDEDMDDYNEDFDQSDDVLGMSGSDDSGGSDADGGDDFEGFGSEDDEEQEEKPAKVQRVRENPYVAPRTTREAPKYVPPSMRKDTGSETEIVARIRRQTQGLVNRVTESNLVPIVEDIEKLYRDNPRQHVSSALVDLLLIQVCEPTALPDTLLILSAGFATAIYKVIGMDLGAQIVQELVDRFSHYYAQAKAAALDGPDVPKQTSNLITFLSQLYNFQLVGPNLLFDYIRFLLSDLSELNAELLLRIVRMCGPALRQDDPMALKDIVTLIRPAVAKVGEDKLSVRTKFMIDTIYNLKNNKMKTGVEASAILSEHGTRMKKTLGTLNSRKLKSTEPLRIGLKDIQESDKKGKWWLVGASWAGPAAGDKANKKQAVDDAKSGDESSDLDDSSDNGAPDVAELARQQMMNTDVRRSIFVAIVSAMDYEDAYVRISKLRLNKERRKEIAFVVMQCCGAEESYNPYYTLIAKKLCSNHKVKWSFQNSLWKLFKRLGESIFGDDADDADDYQEEIELRRLVNNAKMFGTLVADGCLSIGLLKCLNMPYLQRRTRSFVEVMLITILQECQAKENGDAAILKVLQAAEGVPELARGLQWFLKKVIRKTTLAGSPAEAKRLKEACRLAEATVERALTGGLGLE